MRSKEDWSDFDELFQIFKDHVVATLDNYDSDVYVISDPDCALDSAPSNILLVYREILLNNLTGVNLAGVGAALRWDDWPELTNGINYELEYRNAEAKSLTLNQRKYFYLDAAVDTTFVMYRSSEDLIRLSSPTIRLLPPLGARHLDFYLKPDTLSEDYRQYLKKAKNKSANHMIHI